MNPAFRFSRRGRGFTLVELMIALTLGTLVTIGILTILTSMRRTSVSQNGQSQLQDNQRIAMNLAADLVQTAGYYPFGQSVTTVFPTTSTAPVFVTAGQFITGSTVSGNDTLSVRYTTAGTSVALSDAAINCAGNTSTSQQTFTNTLSISNGTLICTPIVGTTLGTPITLVNGVCSMTILYGVQTLSSSTNNSIDSYLGAGSMTSAYWGKVLSVKITMQFANPLANSLLGSPCSSTLPKVSFTRVITVMNNTGVVS